MANILQTIGGIFGSAVGSANPLTPAQGIVDGAAKLIGMFKVSPEVKAQMEQQLTLANLDMQKAELAGQVAAMQGQLDANKAEAASTSIWVAGWRPGVGWTCALALFYHFVGLPFLQFLIALFHYQIPALPILDVGTLVAGILAPLLGLGTMRSYEKVQGADDSTKLQ